MKKILLAASTLAAIGLKAQFCFEPPINVMNAGTNMQAFGLCSADLNGDGFLDVAITNDVSNSISFFYGSGTGSLNLAGQQMVGQAPHCIVAADFNNDGWPDLATANSGTSNFSVLLNNGSGSFPSSNNNPTSGPTKFVISEDFNGDGNADLAFALHTVDQFRVYLGDGAGNFALAHTAFVSTAPYAICSGDFNNDGIKDLATISNNNGNADCALGIGDGTFISSSIISAPNAAQYAVISADYNQDGNTDLISGGGGGMLGRFLGDGAGSFSLGTSEPAGASTRSIALGDFDGDGDKDYVAANYNSGDLSFYEQTPGNMTAVSTINVGGAPRTVVTGDFNNDGRIDVAASNNNTNEVHVFLNSLPQPSIGGASPICNGSAATLVAAGATSYTWSTGVINDSLTVSPASTTSYTVSAGNSGCGITAAAVFTITVNPLPTITATASPSSICAGSPVTLTAGGAQTYTWSHGVTNGVSFTAPASATTYSVTGTDTNGCVSSHTITLSPSVQSAPDICLVTVDSLSLNNVIVWDKTLYQAADTFYVHRDTANNNFAIVGRIPSTALSLFIDTARSVAPVNGDPNITTYRYKLSYQDSCGNFSPLSPYHNSIYHYNISSLFLWNQYEIEGQSIPVPGLSNYVLMRDNAGGTGNYVVAATAGASSTSINDPNYSTYATTADWRVETVWSISCTPSLRYGTNAPQGTIVKSKSNITNNKTTAIQPILNQLISVYPNPAHDQLTVRFNLHVTGTVQLKIYSAVGAEVYSNMLVNPAGDIQINTEHFADGVYTIQLITGAGITTKRIIKQ